MINTNIEENDKYGPSATVASLMDVDNSTCCIDSYKGRPTFAINKNKNSPYPFSFGLLKARLLVKHMDALKNFVDSEGKSLT
jgi:hypothetical protein